MFLPVWAMMGAGPCIWGNTGASRLLQFGLHRIMGRYECVFH